MPFLHNASSTSGNMTQEDQQRVRLFLGALDKAMLGTARQRGFLPSQIPALQPCKFVAVLDSNNLYIAATNLHVGGLPMLNFADHQLETFSPEQILQTVVYQFSYENPFVLTCPKTVLEASEGDRDRVALQLANDYMNNMQAQFDIEARIVRINPIFRGRDFTMNENSVFMLGPFADPFTTIYNDHIKPIVENIPDLICERADDIFGNAPIMEDIWTKINEANIVISELTSRNPNVFYETGIAHTVGKKVILITQTMDDVPFDLRHLRTIVYEYRPRGMQAFEDNLRNTINALK